MIGKNKTLKGTFSKGLYTLTNFPLGLKVVSEKLYLSDAMFSWSQISEMMEMEDDEERGKNIPPPAAKHQICITMEQEDDIHFTILQFTVSKNIHIYNNKILTGKIKSVSVKSKLSTHEHRL